MGVEEGALGYLDRRQQRRVITDDIDAIVDAEFTIVPEPLPISVTVWALLAACSASGMVVGWLIAQL